MICSRAAQFLKVMSDPHMLQESQNLSMFLATQNRIRDTLKETLAKIPNSDDLLCDVINLAVYMFENKMYLTPAEKHMLVKVGLSVGMFLTIGVSSIAMWEILHLTLFPAVPHFCENIPHVLFYFEKVKNC